MKFLDIFSGVGGFRIGMEMAGHECVGFCEFDIFARMSYTMMHLATEEQRKYIESIPTPLKKNGERNLTKRKKELLGKGSEKYRNGEWYANDIRAVNAGNIPKADIWCFGAPCQDFSIAGSRKGLEGDRSSLVREVFRIVSELKEEDRPQYLIYENVKGMLSSNKGWDFASILVEMEALGYDIEYQLLNSKHYGVPQNRERVFIIGHLRGRGTRKVFPIGETDGIYNSTRENEEIHEIASCLTSGGNDKWNGDYIVQIPINREPMIAIPDRRGVKIKEATKRGYTIAEEGDSINLERPNSKTRRGRVGKGVAQTLTANPQQATLQGCRIRRLTPRECFRLQGVTDEYFDRAASVNSDSQLYKQAGNMVTVNVICEIAKRLGDD